MLFRSEGKRLARFSRSHKARAGTTFAFSINEPAKVIFTFTRSQAGRRLRGRCVALTNTNRHHRACTRTVIAGALSFTAHAGLNKVAFEGRLSASKRLPVGRYTLVVLAQNSAGERSQTKKLSFSIVG